MMDVKAVMVLTGISNVRPPEMLTGFTLVSDKKKYEDEK